MEERLPFDHTPRLRHNRHDRACHHRFAAAAFTDNADRLSTIDFEIDTLHGMDDALLQEEFCLQPAHIQEHILTLFLF